jgi:hypothetical protein
MMDIDRWVVHATKLAGTGPGRPPAVDLRRGVSAAYYALYHGLTSHAVDHALPQGTDEEGIALARSYAHGSHRTVCRWVAGQQMPSGKHVRIIVDTARKSPKLVRVAEVFVDLLERRHEADYDAAATFSKAGLLGAVAQVRRGLVDLNSERDTAPYEAFMALLTLGTRELR